MENPTLGIRCRIIARIPTAIHRFDGNSHKIRSDSSRSGRRIKSPGYVPVTSGVALKGPALFPSLFHRFLSDPVTGFFDLDIGIKLIIM